MGDLFSVFSDAAPNMADELPRCSVAPIMADQLQRLVAEKKSVIESVMDVLEKGTEVAATIIGDLFPVFSVAAPIIMLCMDNVESAEDVYMREQFQKVRDRLEVISEEMQRNSEEIKKSAVDAKFFSVEENITHQFRKYKDIIKYFSKPEYCELKKSQFLEHFKGSGGDRNLHVLYHAVIGGDMFSGEPLLGIINNYEEKSLRGVEDSCSRLMNLFCMGVTALMGYTALKGFDEDVEELLKTWNEKMREVQSKMDAVIEDCIASFPEQAELDSRRLVRDRSDLTNQQLADAIIEKLRNKYYWVFWSVRVYRSPASLAQKVFCGLFAGGGEFHCVKGQICFQVPSSDEKLNVIVSYSASPEPVDRNKIQRLIQGQRNISVAAELLFAELPGPCVVHTVKTKCNDLACSWSFTDDELHYWEESVGRNFYICAHSA